MADRPQTQDAESPRPGVTDRIASTLGMSHRPARELATRQDGTTASTTYGERRGIAAALGLTGLAVVAMSPVGGAGAG